MTVSIINVILKRSGHTIPVFYLWYSIALGSCTDGIMNVGEQAAPPFPEATDDDNDHSSDTAARDAATSEDGECEDGGIHYADYCWYLGMGGESCIDACAGRGAYDEATAAVVGSPDQGGSWEACRDIVRLMGLDGEVGAGHREDEEDEGIGCHLWSGVIWWLYRPDLTPEARFPEAERICSCDAKKAPM